MRYLKKFTWLFIANVYSAFIKWLIIIIIARLLSVYDMGAYTLAFAVTAPIMLLGNMKLRSLFITSEKQNFLQYIYFRYITSILLFLIVCIITNVLYKEYLIITILVGMSKLLDMQSELIHAAPQKKLETKLISKLIITRQTIYIASFFMTIYYFEDLKIALIISLLMQFLYLIYEYKIVKDNNQEFFRKDTFVNGFYLEILKLGIPLGLVQMLMSLNTNYPRYVLERYVGAEALGYFAAIVYILTILNLLISSLQQIILPFSAKLIVQNKLVQFKKLFLIKLPLIFMTIGIVLTLLSYNFGGFFLKIIYGENYSDLENLLAMMTIVIVLNLINWNLDTALMSLRYISIQPKINLVALLVTVFSTPVLIDYYNIYGAALSLMISAFIVLLLRYYCVYNKISKILL